jgi:multiple sugar transport system substrate-binding protein
LRKNYFKEVTMRKKRFLWIVIIMLLMPFIFIVAFNGQEGASKKPEEMAAPEISMTGSQKDRAEALGKQYSGVTVTMITEGIAAGPPKAFAPQFEKATGIKIKVIESPFEETMSRPLVEHEAGTGAIDIYRMLPDWVPDFAAAGVIEPVQKYVDKYMTKEDLADIEPGPMLATMIYEGQIWGLLMDGDIFILYYRADIFENPEAQRKFKAKYGYDLAPPKNWEQYDQIGQFITDFTDHEVYGGAGNRAPGQAYFWFNQLFRGAGGRFFNPDTMESTVNSNIGRQTMEQLVKELEFGPPGMENWGTTELWSGFVDGKVAMQFSWPPSGRFAEAASGLANYPTWLPPTKVAGKIKYALLPGAFKGDGPPAAGMMGNGFWALSSDSKNKEAAFAWMMWMNSPEMALKTSLYPSSLMDPYRFSQFDSPQYQAAWPNATLYLETLREAGKYALVPTKMLGGTELDEIADRIVSSVMGGQDIQSALDDAAGKMDAVVNRLGKERVQKSYKDLLKLQDQIRALQK